MTIDENSYLNTIITEHLREDDERDWMDDSDEKYESQRDDRDAED